MAGRECCSTSFNKGFTRNWYRSAHTGMVTARLRWTLDRTLAYQAGKLLAVVLRVVLNVRDGGVCLASWTGEQTLEVV